MKNITTRELIFSAALAALSAVVQLIHIGYQSPQWGMWIDVVAVSWIIAYFLFGIKPALVVTLIGTLIITLFAPDAWLGASMKFIATLPMILSLFFFSRVRKIKLSDFERSSNLIPVLFLGIIIRCVIVIPLNYYYAIPIWTNMTPQQAISAIPWYIIALFNTIQGILDIILAWLIVFRFKLYRYAAWFE